MYVEETRNLLSLINSLKEKEVIMKMGNYFTNYEGRCLSIKRHDAGNEQYLEFDLSIDMNYNPNIQPPSSVQNPIAGLGIGTTIMMSGSYKLSDFVSINIRTSLYCKRLYTISWHRKKQTTYQLEGYGEQIMSALIIDLDNVVINGKHYSISDKSVAFQEDVGKDKNYSILEIMDLCQAV